MQRNWAGVVLWPSIVLVLWFTSIKNILQRWVLYGKLSFTEVPLKTLHKVNTIKWHRYI